MQKHNPPCQHFELCGGCSLQHLPEAEYYEFKKGILRNMLVRLGCAADVLHDVVRVPAGSRRRVEFKTALNKGRILLGFCEAKSKAVVDISMCPVVEPALFELSKKLRDLLANLKKAGNIDGVNVTTLADGFDVYFIAKTAIGAADKEKIIAFAKLNNILRVGEKCGKDELKIFYSAATVSANFGSAKVELPAGAFLQATQAGQDAITEFLLQNSAGAKSIADLYSGCGTYSFPLAQSGAQVSAFEGSYDMALALNAAARKNNLEQNLHAQSRDLYKNPLRAAELRSFDTIVINPPRNGALPQFQQIAASGVANVLVVSCNPATFERDAKCLCEAGYQLEKTVPIDQFLWSNHLELVAKFVKNR